MDLALVAGFLGASHDSGLASIVEGLRGGQLQLMAHSRKVMMNAVWFEHHVKV